MKAVVAAFNQEKALEGAFSVLTNLRMELFQALVSTAMSLSPGNTATAHHCVQTLNFPQRQVLHLLAWSHLVALSKTFTRHHIDNRYLDI